MIIPDFPTRDYGLGVCPVRWAIRPTSYASRALEIYMGDGGWRFRPTLGLRALLAGEYVCMREVSWRCV